MVHHPPRRHCGCWGFLMGFVAAATLAGVRGPAAFGQVPEPPPPEPPTFELPEVVVPGKRPQPIASTPAAISVLTREDLDLLGVATVGEALQFLAEVHMRLQGGLGALTLPGIRGSSPNQVLVLIDGVPVNSAIQGLFDLSTVSTAHVQRVEVLRGPFSAIYGGPALGGVINVVTMDQPATSVQARSGGLSTTAASGQWTSLDGRVRLAADRFASEGSRSNSDVGSTTVLGTAAWETAAGDPVVVRVNHFQSSLGTPGSTAFPSPQARQTETRTVLSSDWTRSRGDGEWAVRAYWWGDDFRFVDPASSVDSRVATQVFGATIQRVVHLAPGRTQVFGAELQSQALVDNGPVGSRQAAIGGLYLQDERQLTPRTVLSTGLRYDLHSVYGGQLNPRVGIVHVIREGVTLRAGIGRTFRGPTLSELYFAPFDNPALRPESAWSADAGLAWQATSGVEVRVGVFGTSAADLIRPDVSFIPQNIGRATMAGGSLEITGQFSPLLRGAVNVTATRAVDDSTGDQLLRVPWVTASAALHLKVAGGTMSALASYVGSRPDVDPAAFTRVVLGGYVVTGLRFASLAGDGAEWQVGVDNVADLQYEPIAGYPAPGRTAFVAYTRRF